MDMHANLHLKLAAQSPNARPNARIEGYQLKRAVKIFDELIGLSLRQSGTGIVSDLLEISACSRREFWLK